MEERGKALLDALGRNPTVQIRELQRQSPGRQHQEPDHHVAIPPSSSGKLPSPAFYVKFHADDIESQSHRTDLGKFQGRRRRRRSGSGSSSRNPTVQIRAVTRRETSSSRRPISPSRNPAVQIREIPSIALGTANKTEFKKSQSHRTDQGSSKLSACRRKSSRKTPRPGERPACAPRIPRYFSCQRTFGEQVRLGLPVPFYS